MAQGFAARGARRRRADVPGARAGRGRGRAPLARPPALPQVPRADARARAAGTQRARPLARVARLGALGARGRRAGPRGGRGDDLASARFTKRFGAHHGGRLAVARDRTRARSWRCSGPTGPARRRRSRRPRASLRPTAGEVAAGRPGRPATRAAAREVLSFLPQRVAFPDALTGREVVEFYRALRGVAAERTPSGAAVRLAQRRRRARPVGHVLGRHGAAAGSRGRDAAGGARAAARRADRRARPRRPVRVLRPGRAAQGREGRRCSSRRTSWATSNGWPIASPCWWRAGSWPP